MRLRDLNELQKSFQEYLLHQHLQIRDAIVSTDNVPAIARLEIYREAYYARLLESLSHDYDILHRLIGDDEFHPLAQNYIDAYPSHFRSIRWFGKDLAHFMRQTGTYDTMPWLIELAEFEWLLSEAFDAQDNSICTLETMAKIPLDLWPQLRFKLHPSFRQLNVSWNTVSMWKSIKEQDEYLSSEKKTAETTCIMWRKQNEVQFCELPRDEIYILNAMASARNFSEICEGLCEWMDEENIALHAAQLLKRFIIDGLIIEIN